MIDKIFKRILKLLGVIGPSDLLKEKNKNENNKL